MLIKTTLLLSFALLTGCFSAPIAPNLTFDKLAIKHPAEAQSCPTLVMPPIPEKVELSISGAQLHADPGGERILRYYVKARALLSP